VSSSAWVVEIAAQAEQNGSVANQDWEVAYCAIGTSISSQNYDCPIVYLASGAVIQIGTYTISGSNTGGVFTYAVVIERLA
jgi:hypothetical protein